MYMRLVHAKYKPEELSQIQKLYDDKFIPRLQQTEGCLGVCLIISDLHLNEGISMTLWKTKEHAEAYEKSGVYRELLDKIRPHLSDTSEWKVQLSKDLTLEYQPVPEEPVIKTYVAAAEMEREMPPRDKSHLMYVRIVSVGIQPGKMEEFKQIYTNEILPVLKNLEGCGFAFMTENVEEKDVALCVTIWDSKQDAEAYESMGLFQMLKSKVEHTFSGLYQWKMALEKEFGGQVVTSKDFKVDTYSVVTGKSFE